MLGSVADGVKNNVDASVLIAKTPFQKGSVLVPVDGSDRSRRAAQVGMLLARTWGTETRILHVFGLNALRYTELGEEEFREIMTKQHLPRGERDIHYVLDFGNAAKQVVKYATHHPQALVVIGSRGLGGLASAVLGGVSNRVAHTVPTNCLIVRK
jgi:nucleotide-binding universal stress UspA family protein